MNDKEGLTEEDLKEFLSAKTYAEQFGILLKHSQKNQKIIEAKRKNAGTRVQNRTQNRVQNPPNTPPSSSPPNSTPS